MRKQHSESASTAIERLGKRVDKEISSLHPNVLDVSGHLYDQIRARDEVFIEINPEFCEAHSELLALLESRGYIKGETAMGRRFSGGLTVVDPTFIALYMCQHFEPAAQIERLQSRLDACSHGQTLDGEQLKDEIGVPLPVIRAWFEVYESMGHGCVSDRIQGAGYQGALPIQ